MAFFLAVKHVLMYLLFILKKITYLGTLPTYSY